MQTNNIISNRNFGFFLCALFVLFSIWCLIEESVSAAILLFLFSLLILLISTHFSFLLAPFNRAWNRFGLTLGKFVNPIILSILFMALIVPVGLIGRLCSRDVLRLKKRSQVSSYWVDRAPDESDSFKNQF